MVKKMFMMIIAVTMSSLAASDSIPTLSIYEIQHTENEDGSGYYDGRTINCTGGIVIHKWSRGKQRVILYDPNNADGWGGILAKGFGTPFADANVGNWISIQNVLVEDSEYTQGNTILSVDEYSTVTIEYENLPLPEPLVVDVNDVAVVYEPDYETCYVTDHRAEKYEGMYIQVRNVMVGDVNVGSHIDNYSLEDESDPNIYCWASDYMNIDKPPDPNKYLPIVQSGQHFCSVSGILEQYTKIDDGWDYYQILTTTIDDLQIEQEGDLDGDCDVDFDDFAILSRNWLIGTK